MIGGRILDGSALTALTDGSDYVRSWTVVASKLGMTLYVTDAALAETRRMRPESAGLLDIFAAHPEVYVADGPDPQMRQNIEDLHKHTGLFDPDAAWAAIESRARDWIVITSDAGRLRRLDPDVAVDELP